MLRELGQSEHLKEVLAAGGRLVVIGAGWIGLEVAAAATDAAVEVTVVEAAPQPLLRVLGGSSPPRWPGCTAGTASTCGSGRAWPRSAPTPYSTTTGDVLPADAVLVGVGVTPIRPSPTRPA